MNNVGSSFVRYCKKNDIGIAVLDYQFTDKGIRIFLNKDCKKIIYYREIKSFKLANYDDEMIYLLYVYKYCIHIVVDKKKDRALIDFLTDKLSFIE